MIDVSEMRASRSTLIGMVIALIVLAIIASVAPDFSGSGRYVKDSLLVGDLIAIILGAIAIGIVIAMRFHLMPVLTYYLGRAFRIHQKSREKAAPHVSDLSQQATNVIAIAIIWPVTINILNRLFYNIYTLMDLDWITIVLIFVFLAILLYYLWKSYQAFQLVLKVVSGVKMKRTVEVAEGASATEEIICPECGTVNPPNAKFCSSCGTELTLVQAEAVTSLTCPKCGTENNLEAKFCVKCGAPLKK